jgi:hypothetical protein
MLGKNGIKVFDHIFPHKLTLKFLGDHSLTPCIIPTIILFATATSNTIGGHLGKGKNEEVRIKTVYLTLRLFYFPRHCVYLT